MQYIFKYKCQFTKYFVYYIRSGNQEMFSIDQKDAEVQQLFTSMKKAATVGQKRQIADLLAKMYEKNDNYSDGIFTRIYRFISDSHDKEEKRVGLIVLCSVGMKMQGSARSAFVNKFHSPVFKLFQINQDQMLIQFMEAAYQVVLEIGGNQNDAAVESNFIQCISLMENSKDIRKMGAYSAIKSMVIFSPYLTFKKLLQKRQDGNDNLQILIQTSRSKNIKVRQAFLNFLEEYVQYVAEKKDQSFQKQTISRLLKNEPAKINSNSEEIIHSYIETLRILLVEMKDLFKAERIQQTINFAMEKIQYKKSQIIQKSLIQLIPQFLDSSIQKQIVNKFLFYLRSIQGEDSVNAQMAINKILHTHYEQEHALMRADKVRDRQKSFMEAYQQVLKQILLQVLKSFQSIFTHHNKQVNKLNEQLITQKVETVLLILKDKKIFQKLVSKEQLQEIASFAILLIINQKTLKLVAEISRKNAHGLGVVLQKKLMIIISKSITGHGRKALFSRQIGPEIKIFLERIQKSSYLQSEDNKVRAIEALSRYKFKEQFRDNIGGFVKDKVLKNYLQWGNWKMRCASVEAAFNLYTKKNTTIAHNQMLEILDKLLRVGMTDSVEAVREKVFSSIHHNSLKIENFEFYFIYPEILCHLFQATEDKNEKIRYLSLEIITIFHSKRPSALLIPFLKKFTYNIFMHLNTNFKYYPEKKYIIKALSIIIWRAPSLIQNHVDILLESMLGYLEDRKNYEGLELIFFGAFKILVESHPYKVIPYLKNICIHVVEALNDKLNPLKRSQSLKLLLSIIKNCGYVVVPYFQIPGMMNCLVYLLKSQISKQARTYLLRIIGGFGAIDRHKYYKIENVIEKCRLQQEACEQVKLTNPSFYFLRRRQQIIMQQIKQDKMRRDMQLYQDDIVVDQQRRKQIYSEGFANSSKKQNRKADDYFKNKISKKSKRNMVLTKLNQQRELQTTNFNLHIIINLLGIINDTFLNDKTQLAYDVLTRIFEILGPELEPDLQSIIPLLISSEIQVMELFIILIRDCDISHYISEITEYCLKSSHQSEDMSLFTDSLDILSSKYHALLRPNIDQIMEKLYQLLQQKGDSPKLQIKIILIYTNLIRLLEPHLSQLIPLLMEKFFNKISEVTNAVIDLLISLSTCSNSLAQYFSLIIGKFAYILQISCHKGHVDCKPCLGNKIGNCTVLFLISYSESFMVYLPIIHKALMICPEPHDLYLKAIHYMENCFYGNIRDQFTTQELDKLIPEIRTPLLNKYQIPKYTRKIQGTEQLIMEFDAAGKSFVDEDWIQWLRKTSVFLLKKSPNLILRACADLAEEYPELGFQFYNISFFNFWQILFDSQKKELLDNLRNILTLEPKAYILIRKKILSLAEFMNRNRCPLQINNSLLAKCAKQCSIHPKSLYYKQLQFQTNPEQTIQQLIEIYMKLGQPQNAYGLLKIAKNMGIQCKIQWYQKLGLYQEAYQLYEKLPANSDYTLKKIICLGYFDQQQFLDQLENNQQLLFDSNIASLACKSYAGLEQWTKVQQIIEKIPKQFDEKPLYQAILAIQHEQSSQAYEFVEETRKRIYNEISQLIAFSSSSESFEKIVKVQKILELEEIIELRDLKRALEKPNKNQNQQIKMHLQNQYTVKSNKIKQVWSDRLLGCTEEENTWTKFASIRSLLFSKLQYFDFFYQYCEICIKNKSLNKCQKIIHAFKKEIQVCQVLDSAKLQMIEVLQIQINFSQGLISRWDQLEKIITFLREHNGIPGSKKGQILFKCAETLMNGHGQIDKLSNEARKKVIQLLDESTKLHINQKHLQMLGNLHLSVLQNPKISGENKNEHLKLALCSFMKLLCSRESDNQYYLQGCLKVLGILFQYSRSQEITDQFNRLYADVPLDVWINVIPQMMAHLCQSDKYSSFIFIIKEILTSIGMKYPQAVLYSLNFAAKSRIPERVKPANEIIRKIHAIHPQFCKQISTISRQLSNAAIKLKQYWYDSIESAWAIYNQSRNIGQVLNVLKNLKEQIYSRKNTNSEIAFHHQFGQEIKDGYELLQAYQDTGNSICLSQAFQTFISVFKKVKDSFQNLKKVYLKNVAPTLMTNYKFSTCIPGMYSLTSKNIKISSFHNELSVLQSKQRPRKLKIYGYDDKQYHFLLKGREDVRLDERAMQFLGLVNKLLQIERQTLKKDLEITKYSIIPLTVNTGLIGWVEGCDTLNEMIKQYRMKNKIRLYVEKEMYQKACQEYLYLPPINKLQIFLAGLESTQGKDLLKIFWYTSQNSEDWVERRRNYTTSLATMSMVGYILGLGDRHPSNIMIKRQSGKVVHIDYGDCFEVAVLREKFPQKIPFRLTRMLQNAMGSAGIHGLYRQTCENVMKVLRDNKESLLSVLETFIHDPILSWRIIIEKQINQIQKKSKLTTPNKIQDEALQRKNQLQRHAIGSIMQGLQEVIHDSLKNIEPGQTPSMRFQYTRTQQSEKINEKAIHALVRIKQKFNGTDWGEKELSVPEQVSRLIREAVSYENICQSWPGWCPYW